MWSHIHIKYALNFRKLFWIDQEYFLQAINLTMKNFSSSLKNRNDNQFSVFIFIFLYLFKRKRISMAHEDVACLKQEINKIGALETWREFKDALVIIVEIPRHKEGLAHHLVCKAPNTLNLCILGFKA